MPERTLFVITTDGMENARRRYDSETVKKMIERQKEKYGWEFLFLGANIAQLKRQSTSVLEQTERSIITLTIRERSSTMRF